MFRFFARRKKNDQKTEFSTLAYCHSKWWKCLYNDALPFQFDSHKHTHTHPYTVIHCPSVHIYAHRFHAQYGGDDVGDNDNSREYVSYKQFYYARFVSFVILFQYISIFGKYNAARLLDRYSISLLLSLPSWWTGVERFAFYHFENVSATRYKCTKSTMANARMVEMEWKSDWDIGNSV